MLLVTAVSDTTDGPAHKRFRADFLLYTFMSGLVYSVSLSTIGYIAVIAMVVLLEPVNYMVAVSKWMEVSPQLRKPLIPIFIEHTMTRVVCVFLNPVGAIVGAVLSDALF